MKRRLAIIGRMIDDFGILFTLKWCYYRFTKQYKKYINLVYDYLCNYLKEMIQEYNDTRTLVDDSKGKKNIWVCWWQGEDAMPILCKVCFERLKSIVPCDYRLTLVTKDNYNEYVRIPEHVIRKLQDGTLPVTQFADILRNALIFYQGGTWIDASIWCNEKIFDDLDNNLNFWSIHLPEVDDENCIGQLISECKWASFLMSGDKGNCISKFVYEGMCKYVNEHVSLIDYFLQNMLIRIAYENVPCIRQMIDAIPISNKHIYDLYRCMDDAFDSVTWEEMQCDTGVFKLTQKRPYSEFVGGEDNVLVSFA